jgi:pyridoxine 5'-phosphate synthase PdxJ
MRYKLTQYAVTKRKQQKQQTEQQRLLAEIREAVSHKRYMGLSSGAMRTLELHQVEAVMEAITPVVERYVVQAKMRIW